MSLLYLQERVENIDFSILFIVRSLPDVVRRIIPGNILAGTLTIKICFKTFYEKLFISFINLKSDPYTSKDLFYRAAMQYV